MKMAKAYIAKSIAAVSAVVFSLCLNAAAYDVISESEAATLGGATGGDEIRKISNSD